MNTQQNILIKILSVVVLLAVLFPSAVKFVHVLEQHEHEVCIDNSTTHMHEMDVDCEFYKFKINPVFTFKIKYADLETSIQNYLKITSQYHFISTYQKLGIALRGPPQLV
ncbi:hypothetical protein [Olleya aquimaris]|uniref:Uncharacterized protein n=1 Tax=Olleya aquimaris TaxID=639310 RepID=A0A327R7T2_9FLAO|nr:hypothetical protein [Olleya aquimaris]RAJ12012.1 hypothetical protein LY08_02512 [Olleya aquimaris]